MKIFTALTLFSMAYVASAAKMVQKTAKLVSAASAPPGVGAPVAGLPSLPATSVVAGSSQTAATVVSSHPTSVGPTVSHGTTTQQSIGSHIYPGIPNDAYYKYYFLGGYPGYDTGVYPGFHGGAYPSYLRWVYPGLDAGLYPGFFRATRHGFSSPLYPGLLKASKRGHFGGAFSRYLSGVYPALFGGAYGSLYGSRFFGNGALEKVLTHLAGYQREVTVTVDPLTGLPAPVTIPVANRVVTIERFVPFPSPYPVPVPAPYPAPFPLPYPGVSKPVSSTTHIGSTTTVSQGGVTAKVLEGGAVLSGQQENLLQTQSHVAVP